MSRHRARKRFGQHFLVDPGVVGAIIDAIAPREGDRMVEIGPGQGALTGLLARARCELHAIELDRDLAARMRSDYAEAANVSIHEADALDFDFATLGDDLRVVGNLPYNISTPLLFHLLEYRDRLVDMHFMLQKEVVDRMAAEPGGKTYGRLSIMLGCHFDIESLFDVGREAFDPPPEVTSSIVRLVPLPAGTYDINDELRFAKLVSQAFSQRRKTIRNSLRGMVDEETLEFVGIDPGLRPEAIAIADYVSLANALD
ncbi:MAG: 16S rRNA (adenine(1518)-N(6)/adenine(1519)-N(6))-dimethyltransferase RsmA [Woeseiaceae bacterium]|nr:16S rRNA (adenine(1518)-N(6)/adenine(1519)-N(6))-dimethyltransferase RsmA [Woeseiaceae bacterium]